jgi:hypothetical protein
VRVHMYLEYLIGIDQPTGAGPAAKNYGNSFNRKRKFYCLV